METNKIVAAILAASKVSALGPGRPADEYIAEYESLLKHFENHLALAGMAEAIKTAGGLAAVVNKSLEGLADADRT